MKSRTAMNETENDKEFDRRLREKASTKKQQLYPREDSKPRPMCYRCRRPRTNCLCADIHPFATRTRFLLLMHPKEARKQKTGTGRLAHLCLSNSQIITGVDFTEDPEVNRILESPDYSPVLLYPGPGSLKIPGEGVRSLQIETRSHLVVALDATWTLARKMLKLSRNFHTLPRLSLDVIQGSRFRIKQQPHAACLSTIETLYYFLDALDREGLEDCRGRHRILLDVLENLCRRQMECANDPELPGYRKRASPSSPRATPSVRPQKRNVFFP